MEKIEEIRQELIFYNKLKDSRLCQLISQLNKILVTCPQEQQLSLCLESIDADLLDILINLLKLKKRVDNSLCL